ncbi:alkene reductase [Rubrivivax sp. RP6-9]|uniref:alkene reductase n=1 Tax=Rubrivivax sp. RP6-9 TaxID=3415750 RepID=UPI003CC69A43
MGALQLPHRMVMAPMTRSRASQPGDVPSALNACYYAQRAGAALIITEGTQISAQGKGYARTPGLHTREQLEGWAKVTRAVHRRGGRIFAQLWHVGRVSHRLLQPGGRLPVAPSAVAPRGVQVFVVDPQDGAQRFVPCETPRPLRREEVPGIVADFRTAARRALQAGFDGVELHGANGYLIDQFLRSTTNLRRDEYGGDARRRVRFLHDVAQAVVDEIGPQRVGVRLSPHVTLMDVADPEIVPTILLAAERLDALGVAYLHMAEADWDDAPTVPIAFRQELRQRFRGTVIVAGRYTPCRAEAILHEGHADLVAFGRAFLANPDLPERVAAGRPLNEPDPGTFFGGGRKGYVDYPRHDA